MLKERSRMAGRLVRAGFTIIEILIAIVVLVLGITGIVALFPTAIESGNQTVEDTYAATVTQSVVDAIAVGLRESRYSWTDGNGREWTYFIFNHDGVLDPIPREPETFDNGNDRVWLRDYCVVLPQADNPNNNNVAEEPIFLFPLPDNNDQRSPSNLEGLNAPDNFAVSNSVETADGTLVTWIPRVFSLGRYRAQNDGDARRGQIREEFLGEDLVPTGPGSATGGTPTIALDPYPTYGFAFSIQRARVDDVDETTGVAPPDGRITVQDHFSNSLYELKVMIFKNFDPQAAIDIDPSATGGGGGDTCPKTNVPIKTFITLISL